MTIMPFMFTRYWIGICLLIIACGATDSLYPLLAFFAGMLVYSTTQ